MASRDLLSAIPILLQTAHFERLRANSSQLYIARLKLGIEVSFAFLGTAVFNESEYPGGDTLQMCVLIKEMIGVSSAITV